MNEQLPGEVTIVRIEERALNPLEVERDFNREVIKDLQAEQRQLMQRIGEIKVELTQRWQTDQRLGMEIRELV